MVNLALVDSVPQSVNLLTQAPDLDTITVARLIGRLSVQHDSLTSQIDNAAIINIGIGVSSVEGFAVAAAAGLPIVSAAASSPARGWLFRDQLRVIKVHSTDTTYEIMVVGESKFDVGAMRKVDKGVLFLIAQQDSIGGTAATVRLSGLVRAMILT